METFWIKALQLVLALVILVTIHEFGHYIFARIFGVKVNRFYIFFNPWFSLAKYYPSEGKLELIAWTKTLNKGTKDETEEPRALVTLRVGKKFPAQTKKGRPSWAATMYGLGWLPLGGYCDIAGMVDETKGVDELASEPQPWELRSQSVWKRFLVMVAGVVFNFILAIAIYAGIAYHWGERTVPYPQAYEGMDYSEPMHQAGVLDGDILLAVNGEDASVQNAKMVVDMVQPGAVLRVLRNHADTVEVTVPKNTFEDLAAMGSDGWIMHYRIPVYVQQVVGGSAAAKAGLQPGDRIVKVANDTTPSHTEFYPAIAKYPDQEITIKVIRDGELIDVAVHPDSNAKLGVGLKGLADIYPVEEVKYGFFASIPRGWRLGVDTLSSYVSSLSILFTKTGVSQVGGFGTLGSLFPEKWNWYMFWQITAFLSVILAFMNIIPIPGLDGGHVLFLLWEMVTGMKVPDKVYEVANTIGFVFLLLLLIWANGNDVIRLLPW